MSAEHSGYSWARPSGPVGGSTTSALADARARRSERERTQVPRVDADWPGRHAGLTPRESEVMGLIAQGLRNDEIAKRLYLSINSVKTYIRSAYRRMGVERRSQAILWAVHNGFDDLPDAPEVSA